MEKKTKAINRFTELPDIAVLEEMEKLLIRADLTNRHNPETTTRIENLKREFGNE